MGLKEYEAYREKIGAYQLAMGIMGVDRDTVAPSAGHGNTARAMALIGKELKEYSDSDENYAMLKELEAQDLGDTMNKEIAQVIKEKDRSRKVPADFFRTYREAYSQGGVVWQQARGKADYGMFKDVLRDLVALEKQKYAFYGYPEKPYNAMLDDREPGMNREKCDALFDRIRERLVPFIHKLRTEGKPISDAPIHTHFPRRQQEEFVEELKKFIAFDSTRIHIGETAHPVTNGFSAQDVRFSVRYFEDSPLQVVFSLVHEYGHAQYALHIAPELQKLALSHSMSAGMHESQSRMLENYIAKRPSFWKNLFPKFVEIFPEQMAGVTFDDFMKMVNVTKAGPVRIFADELTYPLHVLIRYELEKQMMDGEVDYDTLNKQWDDLYEEYLGIRPADDAEGILQDMHWGYGLFGYFPTYVLGSAYSAQFIRAMEKEIDVDAALEAGNFTAITDWLGEKIQKFGGRKDAEDHLRDVCGEKFDPDVYIDYLIDKYTKLYEL